MNKTEKHIAIVSALITIFAFITGIQSLNLFETNKKDSQIVIQEQPISASPLFQIPQNRRTSDNFALSGLKACLIIPAVILCFFISMLAIIPDLALIFFGYKFPCLTYIWGEVIWDQLVISWLWSHAGFLGAVVALLIIPIGILAVLGLMFAIRMN